MAIFGLLVDRRGRMAGSQRASLIPLSNEKSMGAPEGSRTPNPQIRRLGRNLDSKGVRLNPTSA
jgi:hypothetical protein